VDNNIVFTGGLYGDDLIDAYADADVFVNPSLVENFGLVNLEAASCSLPVVAVPVGVAPELLRGHEGLLFNTEEELTDILGKLLEDEDLCTKIGGELRKKVEEEYTWSRAAERVEKVYEEILSQ
jgi:glycosyltransferase involved in cell wall biosynthesis